MAKSNWLVEIKFLDHVTTTGGMNEALECTVYGLLICHDKLSYYVCSWLAGNQLDENADTTTILKSTVTKLTKIKKVKL